MSTLITQDPAEQSPDDDPTGVRDLLSSLPQPDPMPDYLVERINASLTAEQARRATASSVAAVTPLLAPTRRRPGRLLFAIAGTAAAVALFAVVGNSLLNANQSPGVSDSAVAAVTPSTPSARESPQAALSDVEGSASRPDTAPVLQIRLSETRYTQADFVTQARTLLALDQIRKPAQEYAREGPVGTTRGLTDCLGAIGARGAQLVRADLAFYDGRPALVIVATTNGVRTAYAVGRQCSPADPAVLRPATPLP